MSAAASEAHRLAAALLHDVGKYAARTARNLRDGEAIEGPLAEMLLRDVFETWRGRRASERFQELAVELARSLPDPRLESARADLAAIDAAEEGARSGDQAALRSIAERARAVEDALRGVARTVMARARGEAE